jgi:hypothetical protein
MSTTFSAFTFERTSAAFQAFRLPVAARCVSIGTAPQSQLLSLLFFLKLHSLPLRPSGPVRRVAFLEELPKGVNHFLVIQLEKIIRPGAPLRAVRCGEGWF